MSIVTSIIILFPYSEIQIERIDEINSFHESGKNYQFKWIDSSESDEIYFYSGHKKFNSVVLLGSYNHFPIDHFLVHLQNSVKWEDRKYVQLLVKSEKDNDITFKVYADAGQILLVDSEKW
jgi:hypothetical protein